MDCSCGCGCRGDGTTWLAGSAVNVLHQLAPWLDVYHMLDAPCLRTQTVVLTWLYLEGYATLSRPGPHPRDRAFCTEHGRPGPPGRCATHKYASAGNIYVWSLWKLDCKSWRQHAVASARAAGRGAEAELAWGMIVTAADMAGWSGRLQTHLCWSWYSPGRAA